MQKRAQETNVRFDSDYENIDPPEATPPQRGRDTEQEPG